eukprot:1158383-Pelagomonas_calceolata.AAC.1
MPWHRVFQETDWHALQFAITPNVHSPAWIIFIYFCPGVASRAEVPRVGTFRNGVLPLIVSHTLCMI